MMNEIKKRFCRASGRSGSSFQFHKTIGSGLFLSMLLFFFAGVLLAKEIHINGNFQPTPGRDNWAPDGWWVNSFGKKISELSFQFTYSEPDGDGNRVLQITAPEDLKDFAIYGANPFIIPVTDSDKLTFSGEAMGTGKLRAGYYGYKTTPRGGGTINVELDPTKFTSFTHEFSVKDVSGDSSAYIRPVLNFAGGSKVSVKNLKLDIEHFNLDALARKGSRFYPVYKLASTPLMDIDKDEEVWRDIPEGRGFVINKTNLWQEEVRQSSIKMAHDGKNLFVLIHCNDPDIDNIRFLETEIHKPASSVEFAISSRRGSSGTAHAWYHSSSYGESKAINTGQRKAEFPIVFKHGKDFWQAQMSMELDGLLYEDEKLSFEKDYFFNVGRGDNPASGRINTSFAASGFGTPDNFSVLRFFDYRPDNSAEGSDDVLNAPYYAAVSELVRKVAGKDSAAWQKEYSSYGTATGAYLAKAVEHSAQAAKAKSIQEKILVARDFQALDKELRNPIRPIKMKVVNLEAVKNFFVNGSKVDIGKDGWASFSIMQGANVLAAELTPGAKVGFAIEGHPETLGLWRGGEEEGEASWTTPAFDDRQWKMVEAAADGTFVAPQKARQIVFWEQNYHSDYRLTVPIKEWSFSQNGIEQMILFIDSPLAFPLDQFCITWDLPQDIIPLNNVERLHIAVEKSSSPVDGYHRYVYKYRDKLANVEDKKIRKEQLFFQTGDAMPVATKFPIYYSRSAGNFVELKQTLPCRILPPVNGRIGRRLFWEPSWHYSPLTDQEMISKFLLANCKAGLNVVYCGRTTEEFMRASADFPLTFFIHTCYPMDGAGWGMKGALYEYVKNTAEAKAHFFDSSIEWGGKAPPEFPYYMNHRETTRFCLSFAAAEGRMEFIRHIRADIGVMLRKYPEARILWNNWERHAGFTKLERCFCPRCKKDFAKRIGIPEEPPLSNEEIKNRYANEWIDFQNFLDGKVLGIVNSATQGLGMQFVAYNGTSNHGAWKHADGSMIFNLGCPGNGQINSKNQKMVDNAAKFLREECAGITVSMGQMILPNSFWTDGRFDYCVDSDGFFNTDTLKGALIRAAASLHGGSRIDASMQSGSLYFFGEATRLITEYEPLFHRGSRDDSLVSSDDIAYPDALVLVRRTETRKVDEERLVLLFNETAEPRQVTIENLKLRDKASAKVWESASKESISPTKMTVTIPPYDVTAIYIDNPEK